MNISGGALTAILAVIIPCGLTLIGLLYVFFRDRKKDSSSSFRTAIDLTCSELYTKITGEMNASFSTERSAVDVKIKSHTDALQSSTDASFDLVRQSILDSCDDAAALSHTYLEEVKAISALTTEYKTQVTRNQEQADKIFDTLLELLRNRGKSNE